MDTECITLCREAHGVNIPVLCTVCNMNRPLLFIDQDSLISNVVMLSNITLKLESYVNEVLGKQL